MSNKTEIIIQLAHAKFPSLSENDCMLFHAVANGTAADFTAANAEMESAQIDEQNTKPSIQADRIGWLCTSPEIQSFMTHLGLKIIGAKIEGELNLKFASINFPLSFLGCTFVEPLILTSCELHSLDFSESSCVSISAEGISIKKTFFATENFRSSQGINLMMASIGGNLDFRSSTVEDKGNNDALNASGANIKGAVLLSEKFLAIGRVRLYGATIGSNLECCESEFRNPNGFSLDFDGAHVAGSVKLGSRFNSKGSIRLVGASIEGNLSCDGGSFHSPHAFALLADGVRTGGSVLLRRGFKALGEVSFLGASIGSVLSLNGGYFSNSDGDSFLADDITVRRSVMLREGFCSYGSVRFLNAIIGGSLSCETGVFLNPNNDALNVSNAQIGGNIVLSDGFSAAGKVDFSGTKIEGSFACQGGKISNPGKTALMLDNAKIENSIDLRDGFQAQGSVSLINAKIGGDVNCSEGTFFNPFEHSDGYALCFQGANIQGSLHLTDGCRVFGMIDLADSNVGNTLLITGISTAERVVLNLQSAKVHLLADNQDSWPKQGNLNLDGFVYNNISRESPLDGTIRLSWIRLQYQEWKSDTSFLFTPQPYEQLAKVLKDSGHEKSAVKILIGKEKDKTKFEGL